MRGAGRSADRQGLGFVVFVIIVIEWSPPHARAIVIFVVVFVLLADDPVDHAFRPGERVTAKNDGLIVSRSHPDAARF